MTPAERKFWQLANGRVRRMEPDMVRVLLNAFAIIRDSIPEAELARIIATGNVDQVIRIALSEAVLDRAFIPVRHSIRTTAEKGFKFATADLPKAGKVDGTLAVAFDHLNPRVADALRGLESEAINTLQGEAKEVSRAYLENALRDGRAPTVVARELRSVIGLAPHQEVFVRNLRTELETGQYGDAARRKLLDRRFNLAKLDALSPAARAARVDTIVEAYRKSHIALNANVNAKTHTFDSYKIGQKLSWADAKEKGVIPDGYQVIRTWVHLDGQPEPRPEHVRMHGESVPEAHLYSNGDSYAGEHDPFGCHCTDRYQIARIA